MFIRKHLFLENFFGFIYPICIFFFTTHTFAAPLESAKELKNSHHNNQKLKGLHAALKNDKFGKLDSLLIIKDEEMLYERYYHGHNVSKFHKLKSAGKSIASIVVGVAINKGYVEHEEQSIYDFYNLIYKGYKNWNQDKANISIKSLLTMSAGWQCGDIKKYKHHCGYKMWKKDDPIKWVLDLPMQSRPDTVMNYNDAVPVILETVIAIATGKSYVAFTQQNLFEPLGITYNDGLKSRDMAKLGLLYLNKGMWNGQRLISEEWIKRSTSGKISLPKNWKESDEQYAYLWWTNTFYQNDNAVSAFSARGNGGQSITVIPSLNTVIVTTGQDYNNIAVFGKIRRLIQKRIIPNI